MICMDEKKLTTVKIFSDSKGNLDQCVNERGLRNQDALSRLIDWFVVQDKTLQAIILNQVKEDDQLAILDLIRNRLKNNEIDYEYLPDDQVSPNRAHGRELARRAIKKVKAKKAKEPEELVKK